MTTNNDIRRKLLTFSLVGHKINETADPISALAPFVIPIANDNADQLFDANKFRAEMNSRYGLAFSRDVTEVFVSRLANLGFLKRQPDGHRWISREEDSNTVEADRDMLDQIIIAAEHYVSSEKDLLAIKFDESSFLSALMKVILDQHQPLQNAVQAMVDISDADAPAYPKFSAKDGAQYLATEFISWTKDNEPEMFVWLSNLSGTALVSEALVDIRTPSAGQNIRPELTIYLDTPFLMELLGTSGSTQNEDAEYIFQTAKSLKIGVVVFSHSIEELKHNLSAILKAPAGSRRGPTAAALLYNEVQEPVVAAILGNPEHYITQKGIQIVDTTREVGIDRTFFDVNREQGFYASLYSHYSNEHARERDVKSVVWTLCKRRGEIRTDILKSKHLLITRNDKLARLADKFCSEQLQYRTNATPPVVTVRDLAGVMFLLVGNSQRSEISQRQLLLSCQRTKEAAPDILNAMTNAMNTVNPQNAKLMMSAAMQPKYLTLAMDAVVGTGKISAASSEKFLSSVKADMVAAERIKNKKRQQEIEDRHQAESKMQNIIIDKAKTDIYDLKTKKLALQETAEAISLRSWKKYRTYSRVSYVGGIVVFLMVVGALIFIIPTIAEYDTLTKNQRIISSGIASVLAIILGNWKIRPLLRAKLNRYFAKKYSKELVQNYHLEAAEFAKEEPFLPTNRIE